MSDVVDERPSDAATRAGVDEPVLRTRVKRILTIDELRVEHHIALLTARLEVGQPLPVDKVLGPGDGRRGRSRRKVGWLTVVVPLGAEHAIDPPILMLRDAHIVDVGGRHLIVGHGDGLVPEAEIVDAVGTLCHGKERLAVGTLHPHDNHIFALPLDGATVERGIHHDALHEIGVVALAQIVSPGERCVLGSDDRVLILGIDAVSPFTRDIWAGEQLLVAVDQRLETGFEVVHFFRIF